MATSATSRPDLRLGAIQAEPRGRWKSAECSSLFKEIIWNFDVDRPSETFLYSPAIGGEP